MKIAIGRPARTHAGFVTAIIALIALAASGANRPARATETLVPLQVAYAGSMGSLMDGAIRPAIAAALGAELQGRAQGSTGLANLIVAGSIRPDVFISITSEPMRQVLVAGKAARAVPIARTEMVIAYSPHSRFAQAFAHADTPGGTPWWRILESPGLRFGRTDPHTDPLGRNIIFTIELAADHYRQPDLVKNILGPRINPQQIFQEPQLMARLQAGQLDAASAYKTQPAGFGLPFIALPREVNLGDATLADAYRHAAVTLDGKTTHPAPLVFYAAVLTGAAQPAIAARFVAWLQGDASRAILARYHYDVPGDAPALTP